MTIRDENYMWEVVDKEDGSGRKFMMNAKRSSLKDCIKKFKKEFPNVTYPEINLSGMGVALQEHFNVQPSRLYHIPIHETPPETGVYTVTYNR